MCFHFISWLQDNLSEKNYGGIDLQLFTQAIEETLKVPWSYLEVNYPLCFINEKTEMKKSELVAPFPYL